MGKITQTSKAVKAAKLKLIKGGVDDIGVPDNVFYPDKYLHEQPSYTQKVIKEEFPDIYDEDRRAIMQADMAGEVGSTAYDEMMGLYSQMKNMAKDAAENLKSQKDEFSVRRERFNPDVDPERIMTTLASEEYAKGINNGPALQALLDYRKLHDQAKALEVIVSGQDVSQPQLVTGQYLLETDPGTGGTIWDRLKERGVATEGEIRAKGEGRNLNPLVGAAAAVGLGAAAMSDEAEAADDPAWLQRAKDPNNPSTHLNESVKTASFGVDGGKQWLVPTIRMIDGKLTRLTDKQAFEAAREKGDALIFDSVDEATAASKRISAELGTIEKTNKEKQFVPELNIAPAEAAQAKAAYNSAKVRRSRGQSPTRPASPYADQASMRDLAMAIPEAVGMIGSAALAEVASGWAGIFAATHPHLTDYTPEEARRIAQEKNTWVPDNPVALKILQQIGIPLTAIDDWLVEPTARGAGWIGGKIAGPEGATAAYTAVRGVPDIIM